MLLIVLFGMTLQSREAQAGAQPTAEVGSALDEPPLRAHGHALAAPPGQRSSYFLAVVVFHC